MIAIQMRIVRTPLEVTFVHATLVSLEMVICVKVSNENFTLIMHIALLLFDMTQIVWYFTSSVNVHIGLLSRY